MGTYFHARPHLDPDPGRDELDRYTTAQTILDNALDTARHAPAGTDPMTAILAAMTEAAEADADLRVAMGEQDDAHA